MNSLEFIDREIELLKQWLMINKTHGALNYKLKYLQQIKYILEAWEVVKNKSVDIHDVIHCSSLEVFNCGLFEEYCLTQEEYNKIKKALEVENEE